ncbi:DNA (Cytosine-5-)-methyltransferase [uncultured Paludibacter sp.]|uniref:site-specific DNA-methyltransferase (adenine-specific) n=1 Tax=uncultured Paludibacter sp. TaxID=497635 RepID=A0A653AJU9_9BACT|nr:DNA (Cytosine-5-)-methyltransferase [uncultured Paludibacter sp.]
MIKSPLRYPGGKSRAVDLISTLIPEYDEFREPFLGGGSVFIYAKQRFPFKKYWINDIYFELYKFWEMSQKDVDALIDKIYEWKEKYPIGKELYQFLNNHLDDFGDLERAAAFFVYNRITFSGTTLSGGYSEGAFTGRFTESSIKRLNDFAKVVNGSTITNFDYEDVLKKDGNNVFIFLDPPYYSATKSALYGKNGDLHKSFNHKRFAENMKKCKHKWLITYDDSEYIRELFSFANIIPWDLVYGMRNITENSNQKGKELFISNYLDKLPNQQLSLFEPKAKYKVKSKSGQ